MKGVGYEKQMTEGLRKKISNNTKPLDKKGKLKCLYISMRSQQTNQNIGMAKRTHDSERKEIT